MTLKCDHYTTPDAQEAFRLWKPRRGVYWCEECEKWLPLKPKKKPTPVSTKPLF